MKTTKTICFILILISLLCCKKEETQVTPADEVAGTYTGINSYGTNHFPCTVVLTKTSELKVKLTITMNGSSFSFAEIAVVKRGDHTYNLSYSDPTGNIDGNVDGDTLTLLVESGVQNTIFTGTR